MVIFNTVYWINNLQQNNYTNKSDADKILIGNAINERDATKIYNGNNKEESNVKSNYTHGDYIKSSSTYTKGWLEKHNSIYIMENGVIKEKKISQLVLSALESSIENHNNKSNAKIDPHKDIFQWLENTHDDRVSEVPSLGGGTTYTILGLYSTLDDKIYILQSLPDNVKVFVREHEKEHRRRHFLGMSQDEYEVDVSAAYRLGWGMPPRR